MSVAIMALPSGSPVGPPSVSTVYPLSVKQYQQMIAAGILTTEDRVELLEGILVPKMARNPPQDGTIEFITDNLKPRTPTG